MANGRTAEFPYGNRAKRKNLVLVVRGAWCLVTMRDNSLTDTASRDNRSGVHGVIEAMEGLDRLAIGPFV